MTNRAPCSVPGCDMPSKTRGMCGMHTERVRVGNPLGPPKLKAVGVPFEQRYALSVSGCREWRAGVNSAGYGVYKGGYAHRYSHELHVGPIPEGFHIDHLCRNTICVNPAHLEAVEPRTNMLRGLAPDAIAVRLNRCMRGHEFTPENTYHRPDGHGRQCRKCKAIRVAKRSQRVTP